MDADYSAVGGIVSAGSSADTYLHLTTERAALTHFLRSTGNKDFSHGICEFTHETTGSNNHLLTLAFSLSLTKGFSPLGC